MWVLDPLWEPLFIWYGPQRSQGPALRSWGRSGPSGVVRGPAGSVWGPSGGPERTPEGPERPRRAPNDPKTAKLVPGTAGGRTIWDVFYFTQWCFRAGNRPSGPDFGWTATGKALKSALRPSEGRPEGQFWRFPGSSPAKIRPGSPISGPESLLRNIE
jgi:hypothetical protein